MFPTPDTAIRIRRLAHPAGLLRYLDNIRLYLPCLCLQARFHALLLLPLALATHRLRSLSARPAIVTTQDKKHGPRIEDVVAKPRQGCEAGVQA